MKAFVSGPPRPSSKARSAPRRGRRRFPAFSPLLSAFPTGQYPLTPLLDLTTVIGPNRVDEDYGGIRFDYNLSERFHLYARYFRDQGSSSQTQNSTLSQYNQTVVPQNGVVTLTQTLQSVEYSMKQSSA